MQSLPRQACVLMTTLLVAFAAHAGEKGSRFRAGAAVVDVTPERFPVPVNCGFQERTANAAADRIHARGLVLDDGTTSIAVVLVDSCMMSRELIDRAKEMARESTGIPSANMLVAATHTHSAPAAMGCLGTDADPVYAVFLQEQIARCVTLAFKSLAPAHVGWGVVDAPAHTHNRRWVLRSDKHRADPFGQLTVRANMHPGYQNPDFVGPSGPVDPGLTLLAVRSPGGKPIAVFANYSMHYFGTAPLSADYFGRFAEKLSRQLAGDAAGPGPVVMMSQGTSGDLMWMDYGKPQTSQKVDDYAGELSAIALAAYRRIPFHDGATVRMRETTLTLNRRVPDAERLRWAKDGVGRLGNRKPTELPDIYAREAVLLAAEPRRELKLQTIQVGDLGIAAIPAEVFAITGLHIKALSPLTPTCTVELANGAEGYIPPPAQHTLGGYTTWPARTAGLEVDAEPKIAEAVLGLLETVSQRKRHIPAEPGGAYAAAVKASRPIGYWRLDEFHGPTARDQAGQNPADYEGRIGFFLDGPPGNGLGDQAVNRCIHLAGGRVKAEAKALGKDYTVEMWFWNGFPLNVRAVTGWLFARGPSERESVAGDRLALGGTGEHSGELVFSSGSTEPVAGKTVVPVRTWHHVAVVRRGDRVELYLDGRLDAEGKAEAGPRTGRLSFGGQASGADGLEGRIDEVAVFDRALAAEEIARHRAAATVPAR